jgi:hypothetical protein
MRTHPKLMLTFLPVTLSSIAVTFKTSCTSTDQFDMTGVVHRPDIFEVNNYG